MVDQPLLILELHILTLTSDFSEAYYTIMAPSATETETQASLPPSIDKLKASEPTHKYLKSTGILDQYESFDVTPVIGREFPTANLVEWLQASNADELLRELAITSNAPPSNQPPKKQHLTSLTKTP